MPCAAGREMLATERLSFPFVGFFGGKKLEIRRKRSLELSTLPFMGEGLSLRGGGKRPKWPNPPKAIFIPFYATFFGQNVKLMRASMIFGSWVTPCLPTYENVVSTTHILVPSSDRSIVRGASIQKKKCIFLHILYIVFLKNYHFLVLIDEVDIRHEHGLGLPPVCACMKHYIEAAQ